MTFFRSRSRTYIAGLVAFIWIVGNLLYIAGMHLMCGC